jgi:hypothetical protein
LSVGIEVEVAAGHECRLRQPLAQPDVVLRRHVIELDRDLSRSHPCFDQRIGEQIRGIFSELVVGADIAEARALLRQVLLDVHHDLGCEFLTGEHRDGAAEAVARVARDQEARGIGDVVLRERHQRIVSGGGHCRAQLAEKLVFHQCSISQHVRRRFRRMPTARMATCRQGRAARA